MKELFTDLDFIFILVLFLLSPFSPHYLPALVPRVAPLSVAVHLVFTAFWANRVFLFRTLF